MKYPLTISKYSIVIQTAKYNYNIAISKVQEAENIIYSYNKIISNLAIFLFLAW
jgi:hypothetical protein